MPRKPGRRVSKSAVRRLPKPSLPVGVLKVSAADWRKLENEKAYGRKIPEEARGEIIAATRRMLRQSEAEHHARPSRESIKHIARLRKAANDLLAAWTASGLPLASIHFAEECINQELAEVTDDVTFDEFHDHLMLFAGACGRAPARATSVAVEGTRSQAFDDWIRDLTVICERYEWPTGAAKDRPLNPSPFVSFVWELLQGTDPEYRYDPLSPDALATAINEVTRPRTHTTFGRKRARPKKNTSRKRRW
jgi:hypothetical protein